MTLGEYMKQCRNERDYWACERADQQRDEARDEPEPQWSDE